MVSSLCHAVVPSHQKEGVIPQVIHQGPVTRIRRVKSYLGRGSNSPGGSVPVPTKLDCTTEVKPTKGYEQNYMLTQSCNN